MTDKDCLISGFESTFDAFVRDVALTLASGARLVLAEPRNLLQPGYYEALVETHGGTWLQLTPTVWRGDDGRGLATRGRDARRSGRRGDGRRTGRDAG